jgi:hypothetical protein
VVEHNGKVFTYGYDGENNRLWRTFSQYPMVKPPVDEGSKETVLLLPVYIWKIKKKASKVKLMPRRAREKGESGIS